ncbi:hypothetical protein O181_126765 [Austropuccinia psidii MF-1]|uniref:Uncharacterized protein n=1 Tax=Austropuccinia psidii MF-1 TaxID=1389203 RepID=A0A9Q3KX74_9BASI|nr:hypothetical protein [Austropuccinia psidii MF-1]
MDSLFLQRQVQKDTSLVKEQNSFIHRPEERVGNDPRFSERRTSSVKQLQTSSRTVQIQAQRTSEETERSQEKSRQRQLAQTLPTRVKDYKIGTFSHGECVQYGQNAYGGHSQGTGKDEQDLSMQIMDKFRYV